MGRTFFRAFIITSLSCIIFTVLGEPFRIFLRLSEVTEVRPVCALPLLFGISFGFWGTFGCALGNIICDILSGYSPFIIFMGFLFQLAYAWPPVLLWNHWRRFEDNKFRLNRVYKIFQFLLLVLMASIIISFLVWTLMHFLFGTPILGLGWANTFFNQMIFITIIGIPFLICSSLCKQKKDHKTDKNPYLLFSLNEKFILYFLGFSIVISIVASITAYFVFYPKYAGMPMNLWSYTFFACGMALIFSLLPSLLFLYYMERNVTKPLEHISHAAKDFGKEHSIHTEIAKIIRRCSKYLYFSSEIGYLARSYNTMANELGNYVENLTRISAEEEKNKTQLRIAASIQLGAMPNLIEVPGIELYAKMEPALEVGGDFYDFFMQDQKHLAIVIADVSGKGVPAALFMMIAKIILKKNLKNGMSPADAFTATNSELCEINPEEMFVTCYCGILDLDTFKFTFANAGHEKPAICKKDGKFEFGKSVSGFVLGGMEGIKYKNQEYQFAKGDTFFIYTDGIPEAMSPLQEEFGDERLLQALNASKNKSLKELCNDMRKSVAEFNGTAPQFDDLTMIGFRINEH